MHIAIHLKSQLMAEALYQFLAEQGCDHVVVQGKSRADRVAPDVLLVDIKTLSHGLLADYPKVKVLLIDTGTEPETLYATLLAYRIHGILSPHTESHLFKKALKTVGEGQIWIDSGSVKALLHDTGPISPKGKSNPISGREQEVIACVYKGLSNNEIAERLSLSPYTVKAHLNRIFKKLKVTSRSKLRHRPCSAMLSRNEAAAMKHTCFGKKKKARGMVTDRGSPSGEGHTVRRHRICLHHLTPNAAIRA